ncbi:MAG: trimethylamine methyltransferase family protein [Candidatus Kariarchaeaceae archaeon]|jgi:trimethylamine--corrinoid protein Co-methyltransferase
MTKQPKLKILEDELVDEVIVQAKDILETLGVIVENQEGIDLFAKEGIPVNERGRILIPSDLVDKCLSSAPKSVKLYDRDGNLTVRMEGDNICFDPGSAALNILDYDTNEFRHPITSDYIKYAKITDQLEHIHAQSTSMICSDVPKEIADAYRLYLSLINCRKPIVTGTFRKESFSLMKDMLVTIRGDEDKLREKPLAIFDNCPSPPLRIADLGCQSIIDSALAGIPSEMISMPMMGANSPASIFGAVVQHAAETISGIVISQLTSKGAPVIWGGSPSVFDLRKGTTPMGAIETHMIDSAYAQVAKSFALPTHAYMGLSDSKVLDIQAGFETGIGATIAALSGINMISGPGMMDFESSFSLEKLVIDNDICGMALRLVNGITNYEEIITKDLLNQYEEKKQLLSHPTTRNLYKSEFYFPSAAVDRATRDESLQSGTTVKQRAHTIIENILNTPQEFNILENQKRGLDDLMSSNTRKFGLEVLPIQ